jgi:hypothetical protein
MAARAAVRVPAVRPHRGAGCSRERKARGCVRWTAPARRGARDVPPARLAVLPRASAAGYGASSPYEGASSPSERRPEGAGPAGFARVSRPRRTRDTPDVLPVRTLVECAMLAALTGLLFHLSTLFRVDAWFGALFPLPVVIAAARHGNEASARVAVVTTLLLFVLSGPLRAANYVFLHGAMAFSLGALWNKKKSWWVTVPLSAAVRSLGIFASLAFSSLVLRENVMRLLVTQMFGLLDQIAANVGSTAAPTIGGVWFCAVFFVLLNSLSYVAILHAVYAIVLRAVGGIDPEYVNAPEKVKKILGVPPYGAGGAR